MHIVKMAQTETQNLRSLSTFRTLTHMQKNGGRPRKALFCLLFTFFLPFSRQKPFSTSFLHNYPEGGNENTQQGDLVTESTHSSAYI